PGFRDSEDKEHYLSQVRAPEVTGLESKHSLDADSPKILVVEDNENVRSFIKTILQPSYEIVEAGNGREGLERSIDEIPDLIISDVMMPEMDGIELCRQLKKDERTSHIPVILLTARTALIFKVEGMETGADDYITKPFNPLYLEARVKNLID